MARLRKRGRRSGGGVPGGEPQQPSVKREDLLPKTVAEIKAIGAGLGLDLKAVRKKDELIDLVFAAKIKSEGFIDVAGILDVLPEGYGFLRTSGYLPGDRDVYVSQSQVRRFGMRRGDLIQGQTRPAKEGEKYAALTQVDSINGQTPEQAKFRRDFKDLTPVYPDERMAQERDKDSTIGRIVDLISPIGKGQRGLIVSPPKAGKTTVLKEIANSISVNNPEVYLMCLLVDERPEEVTDMERSIRGEVVSSTFDMPADNHIAVAELVLERAKRMVESGYDVCILLDSITRLARAYNLAQPASGRILSGGVDSTALYPPKRFFGAARNIEHGGSLTIIATALVDTGSKMDEVIFEEFKGTGNMELRLDRRLADRRIFPAIDVISSGTRKEELILDPVEAPYIWALRRRLHSGDDQRTDQTTEQLIRLLKQTKSNREFLATLAKAGGGREGNGE
jgi:transcription termination factor Rho